MESKLVLAVLSSLAENESVSISGNQKWSVKQRFRSGTYKMNPPPYGYRWNGETLEINYEESVIVKRIFADFLSGKGIMHIARALDSDKIAPARGKHWCQGSILRILKNENYTGNAVFQKTYNILKNEESFFTKINLHIIQCDTDIQEDRKITSQEEFDDYLAAMKLHGFGGTDFRPVFAYVDKLIQSKEFTNLKGLIYFTDGYGNFPARKPPYETAFVFIDDEYNNPDVPPWAIKLVLPSDEI